MNYDWTLDIGQTEIITLYKDCKTRVYCNLYRAENFRMEYS